MGIRTSRWPAGIPCWADVSVPDVATARGFYEAVLGWQIEDPGAEYGGYVIAHVDGGAVAGIGPQQPGAPTAWTLYFASDDAAATEAAVAGQGGTVVLPTGDVGDLGRLCIALDPTGAAFGVWEAGTHVGAGTVNRPGAMTWEDLRSPDPERARSFYRSVFGFRIDPLPSAGRDYATFAMPDEVAPLGGMGSMVDAQGAPHWLVYFGVTDAHVAADAAERAGGTVVGRDDESQYGRQAEIVDPFGARFRVLEVDPATQPDRAG